jgi:hypothetical protein
MRSLDKSLGFASQSHFKGDAWDIYFNPSAADSSPAGFPASKVRQDHKDHRSRLVDRITKRIIRTALGAVRIEFLVVG